MKVFESSAKRARSWLRVGILCVWLCVGACQEEVPRPVFSEQLVVEGWVRHGQRPDVVDTVTIQALRPYPAGGSPRILNIESVRVEEVDGAVHPYEKSAREGRYVPVMPWQARVGQVYRLVIRRTSDRGASIEYRSSDERLLSAPDIENPTLVCREDRRGDCPRDPELRMHVLSMFFQDAAGVENFYRWRIRVNGQVREDIEGTRLLSDLIFEGERKEHQFLIPALKEGDVLLVELWSLSEAAYRFLLAIALQSAVEEGVPSVPVEGNIRNAQGAQALGFFGAAGFSTLELRIPAF